MKKQKRARFSFRFRRWSRKSYAVFSGLKQAISIGTLRFGMLRQLSKKSNNLILWSDFFALFAGSDEQGQPYTQLNEELMAQLLFCPLQAEEGSKEFYLYGNRAVRST